MVSEPEMLTGASCFVAQPFSWYLCVVKGLPSVPQALKGSGVLQLCAPVGMSASFVTLLVSGRVFLYLPLVFVLSIDP